MKRQVFVALGAFVAFAVVPVCPAFAQDDETAGVDTMESAAETPEEAVPQSPKERGLTAYFPLVRCEEVVGDVQVLRPRTDAPVKAELGKYYPLGSVFMAKTISGRRGVEPSAATFNFGKAVMVKVTEGAEFGTREATSDNKSRTIVLRKGRIMLVLPRQMQDGDLFVAAPHFMLKNMNGNSWIDYTPNGASDTTVVHLVTGLMGAEGSHWSIAQMRAGDELAIATNDDDAFSTISSNSGIYSMVLDQGVRRDKDFDTNEYKETDVKYTFEMAPKCKVKIWRRRPAPGANMVVSTMAIDANGAIKSRRVFAEKRFNINSGELVITQKDREAADRATQQLGDANDTDTVTVTPPPADEPAEDNAPAPAADPADDDDDLF